MCNVYPAIFYQENDGGYSVVFPDLGHLATCGDDLHEARRMAQDCLAGYLWSARKDGEEVPSPTPCEDVDPHCEDEDGDDYVVVFVEAVEVDVEAYAKEHHFGE